MKLQKLLCCLAIVMNGLVPSVDVTGDTGQGENCLAPRSPFYAVREEGQIGRHVRTLADQSDRGQADAAFEPLVREVYTPLRAAQSYMKTMCHQLENVRRILQGVSCKHNHEPADQLLVGMVAAAKETADIIEQALGIVECCLGMWDSFPFMILRDSSEAFLRESKEPSMQNLLREAIVPLGIAELHLRWIKQALDGGEATFRAIMYGKNEFTLVWEAEKEILTDVRSIIASVRQQLLSSSILESRSTGDSALLADGSGRHAIKSILVVHGDVEMQKEWGECLKADVEEKDHPPTVLPCGQVSDAEDWMRSMKMDVLIVKAGRISDAGSERKHTLEGLAFAVQKRLEGFVGSIIVQIETEAEKVWVKQLYRAGVIDGAVRLVPQTRVGIDNLLRRMNKPNREISDQHRLGMLKDSLQGKHEGMAGVDMSEWKPAHYVVSGGTLSVLLRDKYVFLQECLKLLEVMQREDKGLASYITRLQEVMLAHVNKWSKDGVLEERVFSRRDQAIDRLDSMVRYCTSHKEELGHFGKQVRGTRHELNDIASLLDVRVHKHYGLAGSCAQLLGQIMRACESTTKSIDDFLFHVDSRLALLSSTANAGASTIDTRNELSGQTKVDGLMQEFAQSRVCDNSWGDISNALSWTGLVDIVRSVKGVDESVARRLGLAKELGLRIPCIIERVRSGGCSYQEALHLMSFIVKQIQVIVANGDLTGNPDVEEIRSQINRCQRLISHMPDVIRRGAIAVGLRERRICSKHVEPLIPRMLEAEPKIARENSASVFPSLINDETGSFLKSLASA